MSALPEPKAVIFDWDNTLVDTWPIIHEALNTTFRQYGMPEWTMEMTLANVSQSMRDSFPKLFGSRWQAAGNAYRDHYRALHLGKLKPLPQSEAVLQTLEARGTACFVVSNKLGPSLRQEVGHLGWNRYFTCVIGADDAARDKPHPDPVHLVLENTDITLTPDVWFVGDSEVDLACAEACGLSGVLYGEHALSHPEYNATHYRGRPYHAHAQSHKELLALLKY